MIDLVTLNAKLNSASPREIVDWAVKEFSGRLALSVSFGGDGGTVLAHMISANQPPIPILFLDTGLLFPETYGFRDELIARLNLTVIDIKPDRSVKEQEAVHGPRLWERHPDLCCHERKVRPMKEALRGFDAWMTGIRRNQTSSRAKGAILEIDLDYGVHKINPLLSMSDTDIEAYLKLHGLPHHPLRAKGYRSIGCWPCTSPVRHGEDPRAGRWRGTGKTECGLHRALAFSGTKEQ